MPVKGPTPCKGPKPRAPHGGVSRHPWLDRWTRPEAYPRLRGGSNSRASPVSIWSPRTRTCHRHDERGQPSLKFTGMQPYSEEKGMTRSHHLHRYPQAEFLVKGRAAVDASNEKGDGSYLPAARTTSIFSRIVQAQAERRNQLNRARASAKGLAWTPTEEVLMYLLICLETIPSFSDQQGEMTTTIAAQQPKSEIYYASHTTIAPVFGRKSA